MKNIIFSDAEGNKLSGIFSAAGQASSVVIISHGFSSSKDSKLYAELQSELNEAGIGTFRYDYYGHGPLYCRGSAYGVTRDFTLSKAVGSIRAAIGFVRGEGDYGIGLIGSSFGGLLSLVASSEDPGINALALKSPLTEPIEFWRQRLGSERIAKWKKDGVMHYNEHSENFELDYGFWEDLITFNTLEMARDIACPVLIVHGDKDSVVPISQSYSLARIVNAEVRIVNGAGHDYSGISQYVEMKNSITCFLSEKLS